MLRTPNSFLVMVISLLFSGMAASVPAGLAEAPDNVLAISSLGKQSAGIEVQVVAATALPNQISVPGKIDAIPTMQFDQHAPLSGRIQHVNIVAGQLVKRGQTLAVIESTEMNQLAAQFLQSRLETETAFASQKTVLENEVRQAETQLHLCDENLKRITRLYDDKIAAQKDVLQAQTDYRVAVSREAVAKANRDIMLKTLKTRITLTQNPIRQRLEIFGVDKAHIDQMLLDQNTLTTVPILAARSGIITGINASPGMSIDPSTNLFTISDLTKVWATAHVYENDMTRMRLGEKVDVKVHALKGELVQGTLTFIGSQVDPLTRTLPVRAELSNSSGRLKPDMYAELVIETAESTPVIAVPKDAIEMTSGGSTLFIEDRANYREVRVNTGRTLGNLVEITDGIRVGDKVVVRGAFQLHAQLLKDHGGEDQFTSPTEGIHTEDHAVDNHSGAMQMNLQTIVIVIGAAFLLGFGISALLMFRGRAKHECDAELDEDHEAPAPTSLPIIGVDSIKKKNVTKG